ncbi:uncharacterized protein LOC113771396 [Coffea eugenioides]|uniref:uncharacterized protein LOC113771396 n=1 Tax=Coffea eugenioides TaxID=49369 RepID=UPI000F61184A|nr:uncharacterized protein LOC113771396 [Coffea eugenioides]
MTSKDIGWEHGKPVGGNRKIVRCNYCGKIMHGGITRLKEHVGHVIGQVEPCPRASSEVRDLMKMHLKIGKIQRATIKQKKEEILNSFQQESMHGNFNMVGDEEDEAFFEIDEESRMALEKKQMKQAIRESQYLQFLDEQRRHSVSGSRPSMFMSGNMGVGTSNPTTSENKRGLSRNFSVRQADEMTSRGIESHMFPSKQKSVKLMFAKENIKRVGKAVSKFFHFNAIPFHAADNPYYQSMIDEIAKAGSGIKGPSAYQIGNEYLDEEFEELEKYLRDIYDKFSTFGCTLMCDGWSTRTKHPIINFMVYCDRHMIYHSSVDCTNIKKTAEYIFKLMDEVVEVVGEKNVVQVVTDSESSMKAAGQLLMKKRKNLFWSPCAAHCIDLMLEDIGKMDNVKETIAQGKKITKLKRMCTSDEWAEFNNTTKRKAEAIKVAELILSEKFWKKVRNVCAIMEPLVKVLKTIDQDNKPTLPIIYEAMDRAKMAIQKSVKSWKTIWEVIDNRWYNQLHRDLHAAVRRGLKNVIAKLEPNLDAQVDSINEIKIFADKKGGFGSAIAARALPKSLPAEWWLNYGEDAPNLRNIAVKILSQTCTSSGCERNWSTWSLIHTKLRNRLAVKKLHKLVFVHYNMRLKVKNLMHQRDTDDFYNPIDLNHIFHQDDILDDWIRENEQPTLPEDNLDWLDKGIHQTESESSEYQEHDKDGFGDTLSQYITKRNKKGLAASSSRKQKSKTKQTSKQTVPSSSNKSDSSNDDDDNGDNGDGGNNSSRHSGYNRDSQQAGGMSWAQGQDNYYATQDTDHGYRPGIEAQRQFLNDLTQFSSEDTFSHHSGTSQLGYGYDQSYGITPDYYSGYRPFDRPGQVERSTSIHGSGYYEKEIDKSHDGSSFDSNNIGFYGHDSTASYGTSDSVNYRGFGYYHQQIISNPEVLPSNDYGTSSQSSHPVNTPDNSFTLPTQGPMPLPHLFYHSSTNQDDFEPHRHSTWY